MGKEADRSNLVVVTNWRHFALHFVVLYEILPINEPRTLQSKSGQMKCQYWLVIAIHTHTHTHIYIYHHDVQEGLGVFPVPWS